MKQLEKETNMSDPEECAKELLELVPLIMRDIRCEMRSRRTAELAVPQFRTMIFVDQNKGASLSEAADHIGLTLPSMSKMVDNLTRSGLMTREEHPKDRRRVKLAITSRGLKILETSKKGTIKYLAEKLNGVSPKDLETIAKAVKAMQPIFRSHGRCQA